MANMKTEDWADLYRAHLKVGADSTTIENKFGESTKVTGFRPGDQEGTQRLGQVVWHSGSQHDEHRGTEEECENKASDIRSFVETNGLSSMVELNVGGIVKRTDPRPGWRSAVWLQGARWPTGCWNTELWPTKGGTLTSKKTCSPNSSATDCEGTFLALNPLTSRPSCRCSKTCVRLERAFSSIRATTEKSLTRPNWRALSRPTSWSWDATSGTFTNSMAWFKQPGGGVLDR